MDEKSGPAHHYSKFFMNVNQAGQITPPGTLELDVMLVLRGLAYIWPLKY